MLRRDGGPNLIDAGVSTVRIDDTHFEIHGLGPLNELGGQYTLTVDATGIEDLLGNAGIGAAISSWTKLSDVPIVLSIAGVDPLIRNAPVDAVVITFSEPINLATLTTADISLTRDGGGNLLADPLDITQTGGQSYRLGPLGGLTAAEGNYVLSVQAGGVEDLDGNPGLSSHAIAWTMDTTGPEATLIAGIATPVINTATGSLQVTFSEPIDGTSFDYHDLSLTRDGGPNLIGAGVSVQPISPNTWRINGLSGLTGAEGEYEFAVDATGIRDIAGNSGSESETATWSVDRTAPAAAGSLAIAPDTGISDQDGRTNLRDVTLTGSLGEPNLTVSMFDTTTGTNLGTATVTDMSFSRAISFASVGNHRLRVRATDQAGNHADSFFDVFVDVTYPMVEQVDVLTDLGGIRAEALTVRFSEAMNVPGLIADGSILSAVTLVSLDTGAVALEAGQFTYDAATNTVTLSVAAIADDLASGHYQLRLDGSLLTDSAGNPLRGGSGGLMLLDVPALDAAQLVSTAAGPIQAASYSVPSLADWNGDGLQDLIVGEKTADGQGKVRVYLNTGAAAAPVYEAFVYAQAAGGDLAVARQRLHGRVPPGVRLGRRRTQGPRAGPRRWNDPGGVEHHQQHRPYLRHARVSTGRSAGGQGQHQRRRPRRLRHRRLRQRRPLRPGRRRFGRPGAAVPQ